MKYIITYLLISFSLFLKSQWTNVNSISGNSTVKINASCISTNNDIYIIGDDGLDFFSTKGVVYKSTNNGISFTKIKTFNEAYQLSSIIFFDNNNGIIFGQTQTYKGFIARTNNAGISWSIDSLNNTEQIKANSFINNLTGYLADFTIDDLRIYKTTDGGISWSNICDKYFNTGVANDLQFLTENLGFICTQSNTNRLKPATALRTIDGGSTWSILKYEYGESYMSIHFSDYNNGLILTYSGKIYKTTNGGSSWSLVRNASNIQNCAEMKFINPLVGYVISADSILKTIDGGNTWTSVHNISTISLFGYNTTAVNSNGIGIAAGGFGSFYSYTTNFGGLSVNNNLASASISGYDSICNGQNGTLRIDFTGSKPWSVSFTNGSNTQTITNITSSPYFVNIIGTGTRQVYTINNFISNGINSSNIFGKGIIAALNPQPISATLTGTNTICIGDSTSLTIRLKGNKPYTFTYTDGVSNNTISNFNDTIYSFFVKPNQSKNYTIVSVYDKCGTMGTNYGNANITTTTPPISPSNFIAETFNYNKIKLSWTDNATNEDSVIIERKFDSIAFFTKIKSLPANSTSFIDSTAIVNYKYNYRIKYVTNSVNCIGYSDTIHFIIPRLFKQMNFPNPNRTVNYSNKLPYNSWYDWDNDGDMDLIFNQLLINNGNDSFTIVTDTTLNNQLQGHLNISDFNKDNIPDMLRVTTISNNYYNNALSILKGTGNNKFTEIITNDTFSQFNNYQTGITVMDLDNDRDNDIIIPNIKSSVSNSGYAVLLENKLGFNFNKSVIFCCRAVENLILFRNSDSLSSIFYSGIQGGNLTHYRKTIKNCLYPNYILNYTYKNNLSDNFLNINSINVLNVNDLNNDGYVDLINSTGELFRSKIRFLNDNDISTTKKTIQLVSYIYSGLGMDDFDNDGYMDLLISNDNNNMSFWLNDKNDGFTLFDVGFGNSERGSRIATADYNNDGNIDFSVFNNYNYSTGTVIYKNIFANNNKWVNINCVGSNSPKIPLGTKIKIKATINGRSMWQTRYIQTYAPYNAQNSPIAHFGLGDAEQIDSIKIIWPSGVIWDSINITPNQNISIYENYIPLPDTNILERPENIAFDIDVPYNSYSRITDIPIRWCEALNAYSYTVQRKRSGSTNYTDIALLPANQLTFLDTLLLPNTSYVYRIRANRFTQATYSDSIVLLTTKVNIENIPNPYTSSTVNLKFTTSTSKTLMYDIFSTTIWGTNKVATVFASDSGNYLIENLPKGSSICYIIYSYYNSDTTDRTTSNNVCFSVVDYCLPQYRHQLKVGYPGVYYFYDSLNFTSLCKSAELDINQNFSDQTLRCKWLWNNSIVSDGINGTLALSDSSKRGYYQVIINGNSVCPDTTNKVYINFDGSGLNTVNFQLLNNNLHPSNDVISNNNYICYLDTIRIKINSKYPIYDIHNLNGRVGIKFIKDSSIYKIYATNAIDISASSGLELILFDRLESNNAYCRVYSNFNLPGINKKVEFYNYDSIIHPFEDITGNIIDRDIVKETEVYNPVWQYRKHTSLPWINIAQSYSTRYQNNLGYHRRGIYGYNKSGYYRFIDTACNNISTEVLTLYNNRYSELIEAKLLDSNNIIMKNVPYTFIMFNDTTYSTIFKTYTGTTDDYGRLILDSLPLITTPANDIYYLYPWKISFFKDGLLKTFSNKILNSAYYISKDVWRNRWALYRLNLIFKINNELIGVKENSVLEFLNIYPNPASNIINIQFKYKYSANLSMKIIDNLGQVVKELETDKFVKNGIFGANYSLNLSKGLYIILINIGNEQIVQKIVIQ